MFVDQANELRRKDVAEMIAGFRRSDWATFTPFPIVWFACETLARETDE
jgi:hypothetical protein